jgi:hypothetical protein
MFYAAFVGSSIVLDSESAWHKAEFALLRKCLITSHSCSSGVHQSNRPSARHSELSDNRMGSRTAFV